MKRLKNLVIILLSAALSLLFFFPGLSRGMDTDLYTVTGQEVPPNVMIILDNSSSMITQDQPPDYDANFPYPGSFSSNAVYDVEGKAPVAFIEDVENLVCPGAKLNLKVYGIFNGKINGSTFDCTGKTMFLQMGNYLNYLAWTTTSNQPRLGLAKGTLHSYINATDGIRFGLTVFNGNGQGGRVTALISDSKQGMFNALNDIQPSNVVDWTPLAETLYEAMRYFKGGTSAYNQGVSYTTPMQQEYYCAKNYVILITDGAPTHDVADDVNSPVPGEVGDYDNDGNESGTYGDPVLQGSHYLDDVAKYVHEKDLIPDMKGRQNMTVYTIGFNPSLFAIDSTLLQSAAQNGGGQYFYCHNAQSFKIAFQMIIQEVLSRSTSYVAPTVPISQMEKTSSSDSIYLAMFKPTEKSFWKGNIKKFKIATQNDPDKGIKIGDILDTRDNPAIDTETSKIYDEAVSFWSTKEDGGEVEAGGVGGVLQKMAELGSLPQRTIYTYLGGDPYLDHTSNKFNKTNISPAQLGLSTLDERNSLVDFVYGYDAYNEMGLGPAEPRKWILGAFIHSRPVVIHYGTRSVIYAGANDGMLHAFDDSDGRELWAFIPPDLLPKLQNLIGNSIEFYVDGSAKVYVSETSSERILICGERRGGSHYFALDISDPERPKWLWEIHPGLADYVEMGETWSSPHIGKIPYQADPVLFIGGGYDANQDSLPVSKNDLKGRAIYVADARTGGKIWSYSAANNSLMKFSIPSDIARVDTDSDGKIDRLYVGDMGGQVWRFDIGDLSPSNWTGKLIFDSNAPPSNPAPGVDRRKLFYPPDVSLEKDGGDYELLLFGTGDREHPRSTSVSDRLYTVKDRNPSSPLTEGNLVNVTNGIVDGSKPENGWYIVLGSGEKCLAPALVFFGVSYFSTFAPSTGMVRDPCLVGEGDARLYAVNYLTGNAVFNFDLLKDDDPLNDKVDPSTLTTANRSTLIGTAIPSGVIIAVIGGKTLTGFAGVGGGIFKAPMKNSKVLIPIFWRQRF